MRGHFGLRVTATRIRRLLRLIMRRLFVMVVGHLEVMLGGNPLAVSDPGTDDVHRISFPRWDS